MGRGYNFWRNYHSSLSKQQLFVGERDDWCICNANFDEMVSSWKRFYRDRRGHYRAQYPFLKDGQIAAKLKRLWDREKRFTAGESIWCCHACQVPFIFWPTLIFLSKLISMQRGRSMWPISFFLLYTINKQTSCSDSSQLIGQSTLYSPPYSPCYY